MSAPDHDFVYRTRVDRFNQECERFEARFKISIADEVEGIVSHEKFARIRAGKIDLVRALSAGGLWAVLISLHFDLQYVLWDKRSDQI